MDAFVHVVEAKSFSAAARLLSVGQPTISKTIAQLEAQLGVPLLVRSSHGVLPTYSGQRFYNHAKRTITEVDEAERTARGNGTGLTGRLRVAAGVTFARLHIVPHLPNFLALHPDVTVEMALHDRRVDLVKESIDIAVRFGSLSDSAMTARRLGSSPCYVVGAPAYFAECGVPATPSDLLQHRAVVYSRSDAGNVWCFQRGTTKTVVAVPSRLSFSAAEGVRAAVLAGMGVAICSAWLFGPELAAGEVWRVLTDWTLPQVDVWTVYPTGHLPSTKARTFTAFLVRELRRDCFSRELLMSRQASLRLPAAA